MLSATIYEQKTAEKKMKNEQKFNDKRIDTLCEKKLFYSINSQMRLR